MKVPLFLPCVLAAERGRRLGLTGFPRAPSPQWKKYCRTHAGSDPRQKVRRDNLQKTSKFTAYRYPVEVGTDPEQQQRRSRDRNYVGKAELRCVHLSYHVQKRSSKGAARHLSVI